MSNPILLNSSSGIECCVICVVGSMIKFNHVTCLNMFQTRRFCIVMFMHKKMSPVGFIFQKPRVATKLDIEDNHIFFDLTKDVFSY